MPVGAPTEKLQPVAVPTFEKSLPVSPLTASLKAASKTRLEALVMLSLLEVPVSEPDSSVSVANRSGPACYLGGYPGVELLDAGGHHLQDATRSTDSFFGSYPPWLTVWSSPPSGSSAATNNPSSPGIDASGCANLAV